MFPHINLLFKGHIYSKSICGGRIRVNKRIFRCFKNFRQVDVSCKLTALMIVTVDRFNTGNQRFKDLYRNQEKVAVLKLYFFLFSSSCL